MAGNCYRDVLMSAHSDRVVKPEIVRALLTHRFQEVARQIYAGDWVPVEPFTPGELDGMLAGRDAGWVVTGQRRIENGFALLAKLASMPEGR